MLNDWYYSYFYIIIRVNKTDGTAYTANDVIAIASDTCSLVQKLLIKSNGKEVYEADDLNFYTNTKNLLEYTQEYGSSAGQTSFVIQIK